jgi:phage gp36-like protein
MAGYCTLNDLILAFGEDEIRRTSDRAKKGQIDSTVVDKAISDATNEINMYLEGRNLLPVTEVPPALVSIACDIARYYLYINPGEAVEERYKGRKADLLKVADGRLSLGLKANGDPINPQDTVQWDAGASQFARPGGGLW